MDEITRRFPTLRFDHVRELAAIVVEERDSVALLNRVYRGAAWGLACLGCEVVKDRIERLHYEGSHEWLRYVKEAGMAYTVVVDEVPLRVQPDIEDIRDVMPGERAVMMRGQMSLLQPESDPKAILRLEVAQRSGEPVDAVTLYMFEEMTGTMLDSEILYQRGAGSAGTGTPNSGAPLSPMGGEVLRLTRPAQDADPTQRFAFDDLDNVTANDNDGDD